MAHKCIELIFGKLATDEEFRRSFKSDPVGTILGLKRCGLELTQAEMSALVTTDAAIFERVADAIDPRLQKASLRNPPAADDPQPQRRPS